MQEPLHYVGRITISQVMLDGKKEVDNMALDLEYTAEILAETTGMSESDWLEYRRQGIGGSDAAAVLGVSPYTTARDVYFQKIGREPDQLEEANWVALEYGRRLEDLVAEIFARKTGFRIWKEPVMLRHPRYPFMIADTDYLIEMPDGKTAVLECKTGSIYTKENWENDAVPYQYEVQCRHYMAVKNVDTAFIACLFGNSENDFIYRKIERDLDFEESMIEQEEFYWSEYVDKRAEPPLYGSGDMILNSLKRYRARNSGKAEILFDSTESAVLEQILQMKSEKSKADKASRELDGKIKTLYARFAAALGSAIHGRCVAADGSEYLISYKPSVRTAVSKENLEKMKLNDTEMYEKYATSTEIKQFQVKKIKGA